MERLTALRAEGCGRLSAAGCVSLRSGGDSPNGLRVVVAAPPQIIKVSVTDSPFCVIWHDKHSGD